MSGEPEYRPSDEEQESAAAEIPSDADDAAPEDAPVEDAPAGDDENLAAEAGDEEPVEEDLAPAAVSKPKKPVDDDDEEEVQPLEFFAEEEEDVDAAKDWYILKVAVNRESTVADALARRVKMEGLEQYFDEVIVPTEEVTEFTKTGKKRKVKKKLFPGYIVVHMAITDETWFLVRETTGIGDFTGAAGKPSPLPAHEVDRLLARTREPEGEEQKIHNIAFKKGDRVRINEGNFQSFEGEVASIDENNGKVTVEIVIFNRTTPVEFEHWQLEAL